MPRTARLLLPGVPLHIRQRAVDGEACFVEDADRRLYVGLLNELSQACRCSVHAFVLMTNHVHLLISTHEPQATSAFMKHVGQRYAQHFNRVRERTGHLWESRYRSSLVDSGEYLFTCYRYIELNPVRAGLVSSADQYPWSSFGTNALGVPSTFLQPHPEYLRLGRSEGERREAYLAIVQAGLSDTELAAIRASINSNRAFGSPEFIVTAARALGKGVRVTPRGRPRRGVPLSGKRGLSPV